MKTKVKEPTTSTDRSVMFVVMRLNENVGLTNLVTDQIDFVKIQGCFGYLPVYNTLEEAQVASCAGRFQIVAISEVKES